MANENKPENPAPEKEEKIVEEPGKTKNTRKIELKWKHYVLEFFIVALGISVPFLLSKWNENNNMRKSKRQYYVSFKQELTEDLNTINGNISYNLRHIDLLKRGIDIIQHDRNRILVDSLGIIATSTKNYSDFHKNSSIYEVLVNSGEMDVFSNISILLQLQSLGETYTYLNRLERTHQEVILLTFLNTMNYIRLNPLKVIKADSLYSYKFQNNLEIYLALSYEKDSLYNEAVNEIHDLLESLEKELE
jgi:hypothetical protein